MITFKRHLHRYYIRNELVYVVSRAFFIYLLYSLIIVSCSIDHETLSTEYTKSFFSRNVSWERVPSIEYYSCSIINESPLWAFDKNSKVEQVYGAFSQLEYQFPESVKGIKAGESCDGKDILFFSVGRCGITAPKIIIICAQHGFEKNSTYGTLLFVQDVLNSDSDFGKYILENVNLLIFPVANPSGFNSSLYCNANRVNLNRNWPVEGWKAMTDVSSSDYSSLSPLDQPETKAIGKVISDNLDAVLLIDYHTYGGGIVSDISQINELVIPVLPEDDHYYNGIFDVATEHRKRITKLFKEKYGSARKVLTEARIIGALSRCDFYRNKGCLNNYGCQKGIMSLTFEGFNGFPLDDVSFTLEVAEANADLLGNFIYSFCEHFSQMSP